MFKNKLRTAALAGAIAVSTAVSGTVVPAAFAQEAPVNTAAISQNLGFSPADGSAAVGVTAKDHDEDTLKDLTDATGDYLAAYQSKNISTIVSEYLLAAEDGFDPSEEAAKTAFYAAQEEAEAQLATASANITTARESVAYAQQKDEAATAAWEALRDALRNAEGVIDNKNPNVVSLIDDVNAKNVTTGTRFPDFNNLWVADPGVKGDNVDISASVDELLDLQEEVDAQWKEAAKWTTDQSSADYVTREHIKALEALKKAVDAEVAKVLAAQTASENANREAQKSDVIVRQLFLQRATAQRDTLRLLATTFNVGGRYAELYNSPENVNIEGKTLRQWYGGLVPNLIFAANANINLLNDADDAAEDWFLVWESDETNNNDADFYADQKLAFAVATYAKILLNGHTWVEPVQYVRNLDKAPIPAPVPDEDGDNGSTPGGSSELPAIGSSDLGQFAPFAAIAAIIALIAAIFPAISGFLKF
ncbi:S-layer protein PS2 [Corynebacterium pacaense]|uniref:S-layer protein PS2 n=1 Tax=Corynebacterium pacaense TaxID=1816684 RepID=UPI0009BB4636|nr:S-layer protein PS2 [Corynebacterium pacaense]